MICNEFRYIDIESIKVKCGPIKIYHDRPRLGLPDLKYLLLNQDFDCIYEIWIKQNLYYLGLS